MTNLFRVSGGGLPAGLQTDMDAVLNKKFSTSTTYPPLTWPSNVNLLGPLPLRTASGSIASFTDGANNVPIADGVFDIDYDANGYSSLRIGKSAKNLCGGDVLLSNAQAYLPSGTTDTENKTFKFPSNASGTSGVGGFTGTLSYKFKEHTSYTIILAVGKTSVSTNRQINMQITYTDGTYDAFPLLPSDATANTKYIVTFVTNASKTVSYIAKRNQSGTTILWYDECGIFEGALTAQDFEAWSGENHVINFPTGVTIYGGYYDSVTGMLFSTKAADGTDLATPVEYQLDPVALSTAYLDNNFWCDTGDSSITYRADIDALITELGG